MILSALPYAAVVVLGLYACWLSAENERLRQNERLARECMREAMSCRDELYSSACDLRADYAELMAERDAALGELMSMGVEVRVGVVGKERWN